MILTIGSIIKDKSGNEYELIKDIGQGGFGCVYQALRHIDSKIFAVKTLLPAFGSEETMKAFKNEIFMAEKVNGDNIIKYEYVNNGDDYTEYPPYIIMEYAKNGTLQDFINKRRKTNTFLSCDEIVAMYKQLISGMKTINASLVHRDIKPANILISDETLKITDFGLSKVATESTRTNSFKGYGTYKYIAPEAWNNDKNTIQMDIYSMGIVFYELATLQYPYAIKVENIEEYKKAHLYSSVNNLDILQKQTNPTIASAVIRMLEKPIQKRFKNWDEVLEKLSNSQNNIGQSLPDLVYFAISAKNQKDIETQKKYDEKIRKMQEQEHFCNLIKTQFESTIIVPARNFVEQYNINTSSQEKASIIEEGLSGDSLFKYKLRIPDIAQIEFCCKVIFPNSFIRCKAFRDFGEAATCNENYTPQLNKCDIIAWMEIKNSLLYGYNFALCSTTGLYGDWFILNNKNNFSYMSGKERKEPFSFDIDNLDEALRGIDATSNYSSEIEEFDNDTYMKILGFLIGNTQSNPFLKD